MKLSRWRHVALAASCIIALTACKPTSQQKVVQPIDGVAQSLQPNALMDAVFGNMPQKVGADVVRWRAHMDLPALSPAWLPGVAKASAPASEAAAPAQPTDVWITPRQVVRISDDQAALVFDSVAVDSQGAPAQEPNRQVWLGVAYFQRVPAGKASAPKEVGAAEQWKVVQFQPFVDALGFRGQVGDSEVFKLSPSHFLVTFEPAHCEQGVCERRLYAYKLQAGQMEPVLRMPLSGSNIGAYTDCASRLLEEQTKPNKQPAAQHACYAIEGEPHLLSREMGDADVTVQQNGWLAVAGQPRKMVHVSQRYRLVDGQYRQISGTESPLGVEY